MKRIAVFVKTKRVTVVSYDQAWPGEFLKILGQLAPFILPPAIRIEHVGSTSVPGLWAKPIIDIDVVIRDMTVLPEIIARLAGIGYRHEGDLGIPGREAFCYDGKPELKAHHLYVCPESSPELRRHIAFRDYLRAHPDAVAEYGRIKREGAALFPDDIDAYIAHKSPVIEKIYRECGL